MKIQVSILITSLVACGHATRFLKHYTSLNIDHHPCQAHNLKRAMTYICTSDGDVQCVHGWEKDLFENDVTPCSKPICDPPCGSNGECKGPNYCACDVGWEGTNCSKCIDLPGCGHGSCDGGAGAGGDAFGCICDEGYTGGLCDVPLCTPDCRNGMCTAPNTCSCFDGWEGEQCEECENLPGCVHGSCKESFTSEGVGHGCFCEDGFKGPLCDQFDCSPNICVNGRCQMLSDGSMVCLCQTGWQGPNCTECIAQPNGCLSNVCANNTPWTCAKFETET